MGRQGTACLLKKKIFDDGFNYSTDIFRFATLVFQETAKVTASKNMFASVSGMVQNGCGQWNTDAEWSNFIPNIRCIEIFNQNFQSNFNLRGCPPKAPFATIVTATTTTITTTVDYPMTII